jgi:hypothetical protein
MLDAHSGVLLGNGNNVFHLTGMKLNWPLKFSSI